MAAAPHVLCRWLPGRPWHRGLASSPCLLPSPLWADLDSLFIQSEEVRRELPEATQRFAGIDAAVRGVLRGFAVTKNVVACCTREGLCKHLEEQQGELELCEKVSTGVGRSRARAEGTRGSAAARTATSLLPSMGT